MVTKQRDNGRISKESSVLAKIHMVTKREAWGEARSARSVLAKIHMVTKQIGACVHV